MSETPKPQSEWKGPRKIEEEINQYRRDRFEYFMQLVDQELLTEQDAIHMLEKEQEGTVLL